MKKMMMMAMMLVASAAAFAGDSPALKAIMKSKDYVEAAQLVKSTLSELTDNAEKAKAYNKVVDLAMKAYNEQSTIQTENQVNVQMGKETKPVDTKVMMESLICALDAANECDKYDQLPNAKGKVAPKFAEDNKNRLWSQRAQLVNIGQEAGQAKDYPTMLKCWESFLNSDKSTIFKDCDRTQQNGFIGQVAYLTAFYNYQAKEYAKAMNYAEVAIAAPGEFKEDAFKLKLELLKANLTNRQDSLQYVENLRKLYQERPNNNALLENMYNILTGLGEKEAANKVLDDVLAKDPKNFVALADKGIAAMNENKFDEAINWLSKANESSSDNVAIMMYLGTCYCQKAQEMDVKDPKRKELYKKAIEVFDKCKQLDPNKEQANWGYNRQNAYYNYYGPESPEYKAAAADQ